MRYKYRYRSYLDVNMSFKIKDVNDFIKSLGYQTISFRKLFREVSGGITLDKAFDKRYIITSYPLRDSKFVFRNMDDYNNLKKLMRVCMDYIKKREESNIKSEQDFKNTAKARGTALISPVFPTKFDCSVLHLHISEKTKNTGDCLFLYRTHTFFRRYIEEFVRTKIDLEMEIY